MLKIQVLSTLLLISLVPTSVFGQYTITDLGLAPGTSGGGPIGAQSINASGQVVGGFSAPDGSIHAFIWLPAPAYGLSAGLSDLGVLPSRGPWSVATDINDAGQVIGRSGDLISGATRGFTWNSTNGMLDLGALPGNTDSGAYRLNASGQIVGYSANFSGDPNSRAVLWSNGSIVDIAGFPGAGASGINGVGKVGISSTTGTYLWTPNTPNGNAGSLVNLPGIGGSLRINSLDQLTCVKTDNLHACISHLGVTVDLGTLGSYSESLALNDLGQVVGFSQTPSGTYHAFIYAGGVLTDLNSLLPAGSGWELNRASGINASGKIVGFGKINGEVHSYLLNPPATVPKDKNECKNGGWMTLHRADGTRFNNQGDCIQYVNTGK